MSGPDSPAAAPGAGPIVAGASHSAGTGIAGDSSASGAGLAAGSAAPGASSSGNTTAPRVGVVMGSSSDWEVMQQAVNMLRDFGVPFEARVVSAHRMPDEMFDYADSAQARGLRAIIAGAGGAAHLPGMLAAKTIVPVYGVPVPSKYLRGEDSLLSIVQMPRGIPVATFAIGEAGAANAALHVIAQLALDDPLLSARLIEFRRKQSEAARAMTLPAA